MKNINDKNINNALKNSNINIDELKAAAQSAMPSSISAEHCQRTQATKSKKSSQIRRKLKKFFPLLKQRICLIN